MNITALDKLLLSAGAFLISVLPLGAEQELPRPVGDTILTVSGELSRANDGDDAIFDLSMLQELPVASFDTSTEWTEGVAENTGVPLREKRPLWIMYPFDHDDTFINETIASRTIWQFHHMTLRKMIKTAG